MSDTAFLRTGNGRRSWAVDQPVTAAGGSVHARPGGGRVASGAAEAGGDDAPAPEAIALIASGEPAVHSG